LKNNIWAGTTAVVFEVLCWSSLTGDSGWWRVQWQDVFKTVTNP